MQIYDAFELLQTCLICVANDFAIDEIKRNSLWGGFKDETHVQLKIDKDVRCFGIQMCQNRRVSKRFAFHETVDPPVHKRSSLDIDRSLHLQRILSQGSPVS